MGLAEGILLSQSSKAKLMTAISHESLRGCRGDTLSHSSSLSRKAFLNKLMTLRFSATSASLPEELVLLGLDIV